METTAPPPMETFIKKNWKWYVCYFVLYVAVYGALCMRDGLCSEDTTLSGYNTGVYLANGRWLVHIFHQFVGVGPHQPISGLLSGAFIAVALVFQTKVFRMQLAWQKIAYAVLYLACMQWAFILRYAVMCDGLALALLAGSASVYCLSLPFSRKRLLYAAALASLCVAGYQTCALYLASMIVMLIMQKIILGANWREIRSFSLYAFAAMAGGLVLYEAVSLMGRSLVDDDYLAFVNSYQGSMTGWSAMRSMTLEQSIMHFANYAVVMPLKSVLGMRYSGQWVYTTALVALMAIFVRSLLRRKLLVSVLLCVLGTFCIYLPESMTALMPGWVSNMVRVKVAEPVVVAGMWSLFLFQLSLPASGKLVQCVYALCLLLFVKSMYMGALMARDEAYYFQAAMAEIRSMHTAACIEARCSDMDDFNIILCGDVAEKPDEQIFLVKKYGYYLEQPLPYFLHVPIWSKAYIKYARLPRIRLGDAKDIARYRDKLETMPVWPNPGSVSAADAHTILIKIGVCVEITPLFELSPDRP